MSAHHQIRAVAFVVALGAAAPVLAQRVVDLGHPLAVTDPSWDGSRVFQRKGTDGGGYVGGTFSSDEHFGTHLDAPAHFGGTWTVDRIPVDRLVRPGICINVTGKPEDYQITGVKHFPGIHPDAAAYLARDRKVAGLGIDTPSVDYGPSAKFETHNLTMRLNVFHIENAARLTSLPPRGFTLVVAPINLAGGSGGPARVFALLP